MQQNPQVSEKQQEHNAQLRLCETKYFDLDTDLEIVSKSAIFVEF